MYWAARRLCFVPCLSVCDRYVSSLSLGLIAGTVQAAVADSSWLMVDAWECCQSEWTRTAVVLRELGNRLPEIDGRKVKVMMVRLCFTRARARAPALSQHRLRHRHASDLGHDVACGRVPRCVVAICWSRSQ